MYTDLDSPIYDWLFGGRMDNFGKNFNFSEFFSYHFQNLNMEMMEFFNFVNGFRLPNLLGRWLQVTPYSVSRVVRACVRACVIFIFQIFPKKFKFSQKISKYSRKIQNFPKKIEFFLKISNFSHKSL